MELDTQLLQQLVQTQQFEKVHEVCDRHLKSPQCNEKDRKHCLHLKGMAFYLENKIAQSISTFQKVLEMDPRYTDSAISLSIIYNDLGKYEEAKRIYDLANQTLTQKKGGMDEDLDRKFAIKHVEVGDLYFKYQRYDEALEEYVKALRLEPQEPEHRLKIAKAHAKKGFVTRAIQDLQNLSRENPTYIRARIQLGLLYYSVGNLIDAQLEWEKALSLEPETSELQEIRALLQRLDHPQGH